MRIFDINFKKIFLSLNLKLNLKLGRTNANKDSSRKRFILFPDLASNAEDIPDYFNRNKIADEIAYVIKTSVGQMNFLISGEWGIGKTSILNLIEKNITKAKVNSLWFSPWKYTGGKEESNAISRVFLTNLALELGKTNCVNDLYIDKHIKSERNIITQIITLIQLIIVYIIYFGIIFIVLFLLKPFISTALGLFGSIPIIGSIKDLLGEKNILGAISAILALPPLGEYFISKVREEGEMEKINSPELFESKFKTLIERTVKWRRLQSSLSFWEDTFSKTWLFFLGEPLTAIFYKIHLLKLKKIVVFVDDLDRCSVTEVQEFLSGIKTFLEHPKVYYVIAADIDKLRKMMKDKDQEYLRKIIQIDWNVPFLKKDEIKLYLQSLLAQGGAKNYFNPNEIAEIVTILSLQPNPRRIKYYLRRLLFLINVENANLI